MANARPHPKATWTKGNHGVGHIDSYGDVATHNVPEALTHDHARWMAPHDAYAHFTITPGGHVDANTTGPMSTTEFYRLLQQAHWNIAPKWTRPDSIPTWEHTASTPLGNLPLGTEPYFAAAYATLMTPPHSLLTPEQARQAFIAAESIFMSENGHARPEPQRLLNALKTAWQAGGHAQPEDDLAITHPVDDLDTHMLPWSDVYDGELPLPYNDPRWSTVHEASPRYLWHVAPSHARQDIRRDGLLSASGIGEDLYQHMFPDPQNPGGAPLKSNDMVWTWDNGQSAWDWAVDGNDIWRIDARGTDWHKRPITMNTARGEGVFVPSRVHPSRLALMHRDFTEQDRMGTDEPQWARETPARPGDWDQLGPPLEWNPYREQPIKDRYNTPLIKSILGTVDDSGHDFSDVDMSADGQTPLVRCKQCGQRNDDPELAPRCPVTPGPTTEGWNPVEDTIRNAPRDINGDNIDEPVGGWETWGGEPTWENVERCAYCGSPNTGSRSVRSGPDEWLQGNCKDCLGSWTIDQDKPRHQHGEDDPTWQEFWHESRWVEADYQGWTNWHTWNTVLMMDNEHSLYDAVRRLFERGGTPEQIRDWAVRKVIGPYNKERIQEAQEWNSVPQDERVDHNYEQLKDKSQEAADFVDALGFGPDVDDSEPDLIDPELVNWQEVWQHLHDEANENDEYERQDADAKSRWTHYTVGQPDESNHMLDAFIKHVAPTLPPLPEGDYRRNNADRDQYRMYKVPLDELNPDHFGAQHWDQEVVPNGGWNKYLSEYAWDNIGAITHGRATPQQLQRMQQALAAQGHAPEAISNIMRQKFQWDEANQKMRRLDPQQVDKTQYDPTPDQPGDTYIPNEWLSHVSDPLAPHSEELLHYLKGQHSKRPPHTNDADPGFVDDSTEPTSSPDPLPGALSASVRSSKAFTRSGHPDAQIA